MRDDLTIRKDGPGDAAATELLHDAVFGLPTGAQTSRERERVRRLRVDADVIHELTFVAELDARVVGHVVCSRGALEGVPTVVLGPLAVRASLQQQGIGAALIMAVVASADGLGESAILLSGDPEYFGFFGFVAATRAGIGLPQTESQPESVEALQVLTLRAWRPEMSGTLRRAPAFAARD